MSKEEFMKIQKCTLKVHMHCKGCKQKVKKILQKIDGVFIVEIDFEQGKVTVSGIVEPEVLINKLAKSKKHAELWGGSLEDNINSGNNISNQLVNQMKNMKIVNVAGGNSNKGLNRNCESGNNQHKGGVGVGAGQQGQNLQQLQQLQPFQQQMQHLQQHQQMKDQDLKPTPQSNDAKMLPINQNLNMKTVKFNVPKDDSDLSDDELDDVDDRDFDDEMIGPRHPMNNMKMPPLGNGNQMMMSELMNPQMMNAQMLNQQMMNAQKGGIGGSLNNMMNLQMMDSQKRMNNGFGMRGGHHPQMMNAQKGLNNGGHTAGNGKKSGGDGRADGRGGRVVHVQGNDENKGGVISGNSGRVNVGPMGDNRSIQIGGLMSNMSLPMNQMGNLPNIQGPTVGFPDGGGGSGAGVGYFPVAGSGSQGGYFSVAGRGSGGSGGSGGGYFEGGSGYCNSSGGGCFQDGGGARGGYFQGGGGGGAAAIVGGEYFQGVGPHMIVGNPYQQHHMAALMHQQKTQSENENERFKQPIMYGMPSFQMAYMHHPSYTYHYPPHIARTPES